MAVLHFPGFQHFWSLLKALLDLKAPLESPELTGDPTAPTQEPHDNSTKVATTEYVDSAVAELVNSSPAALDTLKELSDAIGGDANFSTTMTNALALKAPLASPALTGSPTAPTQNAGDNSTKIATTAYADRNDATCVHKTGDETVAGVKDFTGVLEVTGDHYSPGAGIVIKGARQNYAFAIKTDAVTKGTAPSAQVYNGIEFYGTAMTKYQDRLAMIEHGVTTGNVNSLFLRAYNLTSVENTNTCTISCNVDASGNAYTSAPTPAAGDNSTKIATTAFVTTAVANEDATCVHLTGNETIAGTKTFSSTITGSVSGNAGTATKIQRAPDGTSFVTAAQAGKSLINSTTTSFGSVFNAPTKSYRVALATYPSNDDYVYLYSVTNANISSGTNTKAKTLSWNASNGTLTADSFSGPLVGNVTGNCSGSSGSCTGNAKTATTLATARDINISDADGTNTGTKISFNGSANGTIKLPATIKASITGNCSGSSGSCTGNAATATKTTATIAVDTTGELVRATMGSNDCFRIAVGGGSNAGWAEIATGDDYNEPIYVRQYQGSFATLKRTATLLDGSGNTSFPGTVTANAFSGPLTGNVTGNCSGSSGSCTGNAKTATTLATARDINISDADGTNTGTKISFNGSANGTIKLPATIKASITGNCSGSSGSCTGNAKTATTLATARKINGVSFNGSADITVADSTKLPLSGGTMTGALTLKGTTLNLSVLDTTEGSTTYRSDDVIKGVSSNSTYGINTLFGGTSNTVIRAGEGAGTLLNELAGNSGETIYLCADGDIVFHPNANKYANKKTVTLNTSAELSGLAKVTATSFAGALTGNVTGNCSGSSGSCTGNAATATTLKTARKINGVSFNGSADITVADSTKLPLAGGTVTGATYFTTDYYRKDTGAVKGTAPSANRWQNGVRFVDNNNVAFGGIERGFLTDKTCRINMIVYKGTTTNTSDNAQIGVGYDKDGNWFTAAPTPATGDNSTKIATTAFVNTKCGNYLPLSGGTMTGNLTQKFTAYERGASTTAYTRELIDVKDKNDVRFALFETTVAADKSSKTCIFAYKTTAASGSNIGQLGIGCNTDGAVYTIAPTPAAADNSTKIATTAWVRARLGNSEFGMKPNYPSNYWRDGNTTYTAGTNGYLIIHGSSDVNIAGAEMHNTYWSYASHQNKSIMYPIAKGQTFWTNTGCWFVPAM